MSKKLATLLTTIIMISVLLSAHSRPGITGPRAQPVPQTPQIEESLPASGVSPSPQQAMRMKSRSALPRSLYRLQLRPCQRAGKLKRQQLQHARQRHHRERTQRAATSEAVVVGWNDSRQFAASGWGGVNSITGFGFSTNGVSSFTDAGSGGFAPPSSLIHMGDPALATDSAGNFYFASLAVDSVMSLTGSRVTVVKSTSTSPIVTSERLSPRHPDERRALRG